MLHQILKGGQIGLPEVARRDIGEIGRMAGIFRSAVHGIVLGTSPEFTVFGILGPLQAAHDGIAHDGGKIRVFAIGLLSPAPSRIAEDVDIGCPDAQAVELLVLARAAIHTLVVLGTKLGRSHIEHLI